MRLKIRIILNREPNLNEIFSQHIADHDLKVWASVSCIHSNKSPTFMLLACVLASCHYFEYRKRLSKKENENSMLLNHKAIV